MAIKAVVIPTSLKDKPYIVTINAYTDYYKHIGCRSFDVVTLDDNGKIAVDCYVDDEGLINSSPVNEYFLRAYRRGIANQPLFGIGVVNITDLDSGESIDLDINAVTRVLMDLGFSYEELSNLRF